MNSPRSVVLEFGAATLAGTARARVVSTLQSPALEDTAFFGLSVPAAGDVNAGGCPDLVVGAPREDVCEDYAGRAYR